MARNKSFVVRFTDVEVGDRKLTLLKAGKVLTDKPKVTAFGYGRLTADPEVTPKWSYFRIATTQPLIAIALHDSIGDQIWIKTGAGRNRIAFQAHPRDTHILTVQSRVMNPRSEAFVVSQCMANLQSKVAGVRVDEAR